MFKQFLSRWLFEKSSRTLAWSIYFNSEEVDIFSIDFKSEE